MMVSFSLNVVHALDDWNEYVGERARQGWGGGDEDLSVALQHLARKCCVNFKKDFLPDEMLAFMLATFPRQLLFTIGKRRSAYLTTLFGYWHPELHVWASVLWRFTGKSCNLFGQVIAANQGIDTNNPRPGRNQACFGQALFRYAPTMPLNGITEEALQSAIGAIVRFPLHDSLARMHETDIYHYTQYLTPVEVGQVCQRLLLFRARPKECMCGWRFCEAGCTCKLKLELDPSKEYAFALLRLIGERHSGDYHFQHPDEKNPNGGIPDTWSPEHEAQFLKAACNVVFSAGAYKEIYQNLRLHEKFRSQEPPLANPRKLSDVEQNNNYTRPQDQDYDNAVSKHGGCIHRNCKQIFKRDCSNVSCGSHCVQSGMLHCRRHHNQGHQLPPVDLRTPFQLEAQGPAKGGVGNGRNGHAQGSANGGMGDGRKGRNGYA